MNYQLFVYQQQIKFIQDQLYYLESDLLSVTKSPKYFIKNLSVNKIRLKPIEKGIHELKYLLRNPELCADYETESYLMKRIHVLNKEANHLNSRVNYYRKEILRYREANKHETIQGKIDAFKGALDHLTKLSDELMEKEHG